MAFDALEFSFRLILVVMVAAVAVIALTILARAIEPRGIWALARRLRRSGRSLDPPSGRPSGRPSSDGAR